MTNALGLAPSAARPTTDPRVRLLRGVAGWWAVGDGRVAHLPDDAVVERDGRPEPTVDAQAVLERRGFFRAAPSTTYALTVLTATACNLGCAYCFQNTAAPDPGSSAPPRIRNAVLTDDLIRRLSTFVARQRRETGRDATSLLIFGGEPLLNVRGVLRLLEAMQVHRLTTSELVTNGVLLTPRIARRLAGAGLARVQVTFDGARADHDTIRVTRNGRPTYDTIIANVAAAAAETDLAWNFRVNVSQRNLKDLDRLVHDLGGVVDGRRASLHLALIDDVGIGYDNTVTYDLQCARAFADLNRQAIAAGMTVPLSRPLGDCPYCGEVGGTSGAVVNADGILYSCWETAGRPEWAVGDVDHGYVETSLPARWVACDHDAAPHGSADDAQAFFDLVDAATLDATYGKRARDLTPAR